LVAQRDPVTQVVAPIGPEGALDEVMGVLGRGATDNAGVVVAGKHRGAPSVTGKEIARVWMDGRNGPRERK
jgi:hypothetical protein